MEEGEVDVRAALKQACEEAGYHVETYADFVGDFYGDDEYPDELLERIMFIASCNDEAKIRRMLGAVLEEVLTARGAVDTEKEGTLFDSAGRELVHAGLTCHVGMLGPRGFRAAVAVVPLYVPRDPEALSHADAQRLATLVAAH